MGAFDLSDWLWPGVSQGRQPSVYPLSIDYTSDLLAPGFQFYGATGEKDFNSDTYATHLAPSLALTGTFSNSGVSIRSNFVGNGGANSDGVVFGSNLSAVQSFTVAMRLRVNGTYNPSPYGVGVIGSVASTSACGLLMGATSATVGNIGVIGGSGGAFTRYEGITFPSAGTEFDLVYQVTNVSGLLPTAYAGARIFLDGVDLLSIVAPTLNGGIPGYGALTQEFVLGLAPNTYTNYYGTTTDLVYALIVPNVLWTPEQTARFRDNPWQLFEQPKIPFRTASSVPANALSGDSPQEQRATGTVSLSVPVAGISIQKAVGKGVANVGIPLAGDATVRQNAAGDLLISVPLDGAAIQRQLDSGTLSMATSISGQTKQSQSILGALSISVTMAGDAIQRAYADGTLTNTAAGAINLTGSSRQTQIAHGLVSIAVGLSGHSLSVQSGDGKLTTLVPLSGVIAQAQLVSGGLGVTVDLLGHMLQKAISNASLSVSGGGGVSLSGHSTQHQAAESTMMLQVVLSGKSVQESIAQGYLSGAGALSIDPRYLITALGRSFAL